MSIYLIVLDGRNPASPAAEKKRRQRLKMSQEKKGRPEGEGKTFQECKASRGNPGR